MSTRSTWVDADLWFSVTVAGREPICGSLVGSGSDLTLTVSDPAAFAGSGDAVTLRRVADELAAAGLRLRVTDPSGTALLVLGSVRCPWWQRPVTRSPHMRLAGLRGLVAASRGRMRDEGAGPSLTPPYPVAPTFLRRPVRRVTTTHDPARGGGPRLVHVPGDGVWRPESPVHWLQDRVTVLGSDPSCDVVLPGLAPRHVEVHHDEADEFVLLALAPGVRVYGEQVRRHLLRTSARIEVGGHVLVYVREEYADHGRPFAGRIGGELGRQRPQPPRAAAPVEP